MVQKREQLQITKSAEQKKTVGHFINKEAEIKFLGIYDKAMEQWPSSRQEIDIETSYGLTHVYRFGAQNGIPIVLLHGANGTSASWANFVVDLGKNHPVFAVDTIGDAGKSIQKSPIQRAEDYSSWLDEVLNALDVTKVHLIGASYGGWITLNQAVHSPQLLQSITLIEPARALAGLKFMAWPFMIWASMIGPDFVRRAFINWSSVSSSSNELQQQLVVSAMRDYKMQRIPPQYISDEELQSVKVPTLVLLGEKSPMHNSKRAATRAKKLLQNVEVEILPKAGHQLSADLVNDRILRFVEYEKKSSK